MKKFYNCGNKAVDFTKFDSFYRSDCKTIYCYSLKVTDRVAESVKFKTREEADKCWNYILNIEE